MAVLKTGLCARRSTEEVFLGLIDKGGEVDSIGLVFLSAFVVGEKVSMYTCVVKNCVDCWYRTRQFKKQ